MNTEERLRALLKVEPNAWPRYSHTAQDVVHRERTRRMLTGAIVVVGLVAAGFIVAADLHRGRARTFVGTPAEPAAWFDRVAGYHVRVPEGWTMQGGEGAWASFGLPVHATASGNDLDSRAYVGVHIVVDEHTTYASEVSTWESIIGPAAQPKAVSVAGRKATRWDVHIPGPNGSQDPTSRLAGEVCMSCSASIYIVDWPSPWVMRIQVRVGDNSHPEEDERASSLVDSLASYTYRGGDGPVAGITDPATVVKRYEEARIAGSGAAEWMSRETQPDGVCFGTGGLYGITSYSIVSVRSGTGGRLDFLVQVDVDNGMTQSTETGDVSVGPGVDVEGFHHPWLILGGDSIDDPDAPCVSSRSPAILPRS